KTGKRCLFVTRVRGYKREPFPPARTTPFILYAFSLRWKELPSALMLPQALHPLDDKIPVSQRVQDIRYGRSSFLRCLETVLLTWNTPNDFVSGNKMQRLCSVARYVSRETRHLKRGLF